ncbi:MAG: FAD-binding oxidoreductase [Planctomycetota bacterium]
MSRSTIAIGRRGPARSYELVEAWGMAAGACSRVLRPRSVAEIAGVLEAARREGASVGLRGTGNSYGDASLNGAGHVLDLRRLNRILAFDRETGVVEAEPGVTIGELWKHVLPRGWWPRVVPGTMFPTLAGAAAMNVHGKNNYAVGTIGDAILDFDLVLPGGEVRTCSRTENSALFHAAIGGFGMLGVFSRLRLATKRVHSGDLEVRAIASRNLREMLEVMESRRSTADYLVGWVDCFPGGDASGRGLVHEARHLARGEDPDPAETLRLSHQDLPRSILGVFPKSEVWRVLRRFNRDLGMRAINAVKYWAGRFAALGEPFRQPLAAFSFLLDYVPNWKWSYGRAEGHGLIQVQSFLPAAAAHDVFLELLARSRRADLVPYLGVMKRHRPDPFLLTHGLDGWSLALDFKVTPARRAALWRHGAELTRIVLDAGGRFYLAKDLVLAPADVRRMYGPDALARFLSLKRELDPGSVLQTDLWRRLFPAAGQSSTGE